MKQNLIAFVIWLTVFLWICLIVKQFTQKQNECFDRLEVIQLRIKELEQLKQDTQSEINQHEMDITTLKQVMEQLNNEETELNIEALNWKINIKK